MVQEEWTYDPSRLCELHPTIGYSPFRNNPQSPTRLTTLTVNTELDDEVRISSAGCVTSSRPSKDCGWRKKSEPPTPKFSLFRAGIGPLFSPRDSRKKKLWCEAGRQQLESLPVAHWASRRRLDLLEVLDRINPTISELTRAIEQRAERSHEAQGLMTHPGVRILTTLAFVLILREAGRCRSGKQIASDLGLGPEELSSGERRRLDTSATGQLAITFSVGGAVQVTVRSDVRWRNRFIHLAKRKGRKVAKVAVARRLGVRCYGMWRRRWNYEQLESFGSHARQPGNPHGVK